MPFAFRSAVRTLRRRPADALVNGLGLSLGLACCALIALHVAAERGADRQHADGDRVVRLGVDLTDAGGNAQGIPSMPRPLLAVVSADPAVEAVAGARDSRLRVPLPGGTQTAEVLFAGAGFLDVLNGYRLVAGDARTALAHPNSIVLTEATAARLGAQALGSVVEVDDGGPYTVTGIVADGGRSHLAFDGLVSFSTLRPDWAEGAWGQFDLTLYARLRPGADRAAFVRRVQRAFDAGVGDAMAEGGQHSALIAQPLRGIYLAGDGRLAMPMHRAGSPELLRILSLVGLFVLAIAVVNFVNLATARSAERAREIGVRKAVGADRAGLVVQFLVEAVVLAVLSGVVALGLVALALPGYDALTDAGLTLADLVAPRTLGTGAALVVGVGLLAGAYPALALSGFRPAETLRGQVQSGPRASRLRGGLVVFQFAVSTVLLVATLVVGSQLQHLRAAPVGFDRDGVLLVPVSDLSAQTAADIKAAFGGVAGVRAVSLTGAPPTETGWESQQVAARGASGATQNMEAVIADADYARALGLRVVAGRDLSPDVASDAETAVLLNEAAAHALGWTPEEAVDKLIETSGRWPGEVVGVLADYAHHGVAHVPGPQVFFDLSGNASWAVVRVAPGAEASVRAGLAAAWASRVQGFPFEAAALGDAVAAQYRAEERLARAFGLFAGLAIVVAALGLFGLAAYAVQRRRKEVGVRKVLGATVGQIVARLTADFARPVLVGFAIAVPVAAWALSRWLDGFASRVALSPVPFLVAGAIALAVAMATVSLHTLRAATADPVRSLRSE